MLKEINETLLNKYFNKEITQKQLAELLDVREQTIGAYFKRKGLKNNKDLLKESINHSFFKSIDSEIKAYLLGFFVADGCIYLNKTKYSQLKTFSVGVTEKDKEVVELYKEYLCPNHNIRITTDHGSFNKEYLSKPIHVIKFTSSEIFDDITSHGYGINKTFTEKHLPVLNEELLTHFIRGYFDGDGSVSINNGKRKNGKPYCNYNSNIVSKTKDILIEIQKVLLKFNIQSSISTSKTCWYINVSGRKNNIRLFEFMYNNASFFIKRKQNKFASIPKELQPINNTNLENIKN